MTRAIALTFALAACSQQPVQQNAVAVPEPTAPTPAASATPVPTPTARGFPPVTELPKGLVGTWTADPAGKCTPGTELRIVVEPGRIRFYESEARITAITQVDPHSWGIDAEVAGEGGTERRSFDLNLNEDGSMTRVQAPIPDITYTRCKG